MAHLISSFKEIINPDDLELHLEDVDREMKLIETVERFRDAMGFRLDHADLKNAHILLMEERERCQKKLRHLRGQKKLTITFEEEEEEQDISSLAKKYSIEHVIEGEGGKERPVKPDDLHIDRHEGVYEAFKVVYEMQKHYELRKECEEEEEEDEEDEDDEDFPSPNKFELENEENFIELSKEE